MTLRACTFGIVLLCASLGSSALNLGRVRGVAIVGQPLDVTVQVQLDGDETPTSLCVEADVFHADTRQDSGRVRVTIEPGAQPLSANVRIFSSAAIDEPVVTIYLKAGCGQKSTRKYVLLADYASEPAVITAPAVLPLVAAGAGSTPPTVVAPASGTVGAAATGPTNREAGRPTNIAGSESRPQGAVNARKRVPVIPDQQMVSQAKRPQPPEVAPPKPVPKAGDADKSTETSKEVASGKSGQSRLKLDPLVMLAERVASLETSTSAPPPELAKDSQRLQSLESDVKALLLLAAKNEASLLEMRMRLQKVEADRLPAEWVYSLTALVIAALGMVVFLLARRRSSASAPGSNTWWSGSKPAPIAPAQSATAETISIPAELVAVPSHTQAETHPPTMGLQPSSLRPVQSVRPVMDDDLVSEMDVSLVEMSPSNFDNLMQSSESHSALRKGPLPVPVEARRSGLQPVDQRRAINSEELFDIRQQAEFFVSLGQTDQAVRILENRVSEDGETSPLIYLDLLKIFHSLGLKTDFRQFREDFNLLFNGRVPEFDSFSEEGKGLEGYPHVLAHIIALWGTSKAQMVIESSIFRDPWDDKSSPFDLAAFRDLLLLHAIAQTAVQPLVARRPDNRALPGPHDVAAAAGLGWVDPAVPKATDRQGERAAPAVDLNLSVVGELDLDLNRKAPVADVLSSSGDGDPDFPVLITDDGASPTNRSQAGAEILLDFSLPDPSPGPVKKAGH